jgi:hypothetical protein
MARRLRFEQLSMEHGPTKANTASLSTVKILLQSVVSDNENFMTLDIKDFYLNTLLPRFE